MEFFVTQEGLSQDDIANDVISVFIQGGNITYFYIMMPKKINTSSKWMEYFKYLYLLSENHPEYDQLINLLDIIPRLLTATIVGADSSVAYETYENVLLGLFYFLEASVAFTLVEAYPETYKKLRNELFQLVVNYPQSHDRYMVEFSSFGKIKWGIPLICEDDHYLDEVSQPTLTAYSRSDELHVHQFIENYKYYQLNITEQAAEIYHNLQNAADRIEIKQAIMVFNSLTKALIALILNDISGTGIYIARVPDMCEFIVKNEFENVEAQKVYLEPILRSREGEQEKIDRLGRIIEDIKRDIRNAEQVQSSGSLSTQQPTKSADDRRLVEVISIIADHYLRFYNLHYSAYFWRKIDKRDILLRFFLTFHRRPYIYLVLQGLALLVIFICTNFHINVPTHISCNIHKNALTCTGSIAQYLLFVPLLLFFIPLLLAFIVLISIILQLAQFILRKKIKSQRWLYAQLLLPRIFGASIVGLLPLLFNSQSWFIGILSVLPVNILLSILTYIASFLYIFIEVYNTTKFVENNSVMNAFKESGRIFCIACSETLSVVAIISTLLIPVVFPSLGLQNAGFQHFVNLGDNRALYADAGSWIPFGFFPSLILLWTGISLFIGSFVQLLWQEKRITDSI